MRRMFGFLIGILVGGLVGATVTLLLTPESGEILRKELRARGQNLVEDIRHAGEARQIELQHHLENLQAPRN